MSKAISSALKAHLALPLTTLATCWRIECLDSTVYGFTNHDVDLVIDGVTYLASSGATGTSIDSSSSASAGNTEIVGLLDNVTLREEDLVMGKFNYAALWVFMVNWVTLGQGTLPLLRGQLGEVTLERSGFKVEFNSLVDELSQTIGLLYSYDCRANFGDYPVEIPGAKCGVDLSGYTVTGTVTTGGSVSSFQDTGRTEAADYFRYGLVTFTSGLNEGFSMEISGYTTGSFTLANTLPNLITAGDTYTAFPGCAHTPTACKAYGNYINYKGEPDVPGIDRMLNYPPDYPETQMDGDQPVNY